MQELRIKVEALEEHATVAQRAISSLRLLVAMLEKRVNKLEVRVFGAGFMGSAFGAACVYGGYLAITHLLKGR